MKSAFFMWVKYFSPKQIVILYKILAYILCAFKSSGRQPPQDQKYFQPRQSGQP